MTLPNKPAPKACGRCGGSFECLSHSGGCWCESLPKLSKLIPNSDCLCPSCLKKEIENQKTESPLP